MSVIISVFMIAVLAGVIAYLGGYIRSAKAEYDACMFEDTTKAMAEELDNLVEEDLQKEADAEKVEEKVEEEKPVEKKPSKKKPSKKKSTKNKK